MSSHFANTYPCRMTTTSRVCSDKRVFYWAKHELFMNHLISYSPINNELYIWLNDRVADTIIFNSLCKNTTFGLLFKLPVTDTFVLGRAFYFLFFWVYQNYIDTFFMPIKIQKQMSIATASSLTLIMFIYYSKLLIR